MSHIPGRATAEGTRRFTRRFSRVAPEFFRLTGDLTVSSVGLGTFPGRADESTDAGYAAAIERALELGCNVIDTSVAYRHQRSERVIGKTLARLIGCGKQDRDSMVVASKAGFIPFDSEYPGSPGQYFEETFIRTGIVDPAEVVGRGHCLAPGFLRHQIATSRRNLCCATVDIYFLHNPETQLREVDRLGFRTRLLTAFETLERAVADGSIGMYGVSTWSGFRSLPESGDYLPLCDLVRWAAEVGGPDHHFRVIMVPFNLAMPEAFALSNQRPSRELPLDLPASGGGRSRDHRAGWRLAAPSPPHLRPARGGPCHGRRGAAQQRATGPAIRTLGAGAHDCSRRNEPHRARRGEPGSRCGPSAVRRLLRRALRSLRISIPEVLT